MCPPGEWGGWVKVWGEVEAGRVSEEAEAAAVTVVGSVARQVLL